MIIRWIKRLLHKSNNESVNEGVNVVDSICKAKSLYKELIKFAHPDRHPDNSDYFKEMTDRINANRYNYNELMKIKKELLAAK